MDRRHSRNPLPALSRRTELTLLVLTGLMWGGIAWLCMIGATIR